MTVAFQGATVLFNSMTDIEKLPEARVVGEVYFMGKHMLIPTSKLWDEYEIIPEEGYALFLGTEYDEYANKELDVFLFKEQKCYLAVQTPLISTVNLEFATVQPVEEIELSFHISTEDEGDG